MAELSSQVANAAQPILQEFFKWWSQRLARSAASDAGSLRFWRDGMLKHLELISRGEASKATFVELRKDFKATSKPVQEAIAKLVTVRRKLAARGAPELAEQVDIILHEKQLGKDSVRRNIEYILEHPEDEGTRNLAVEVCNQIGVLNAAIARLQRSASQ